MKDILMPSLLLDGVIVWLACVGAYLVGSIPCGYLISRLFGVTDIREHGSGNIGATNVARILGKPFFALVLFLDATKAYGYTALVIHYFGSEFWIVALCVMALLIGNSFPIFLNFRGGKGVATAVGCMLALQPTIFVMFAIMWTFFLFSSYFLDSKIIKKVGYASVMASWQLPVFSYFIYHDHWTLSVLFFCIALLIQMRHGDITKRSSKLVA